MPLPSLPWGEIIIAAVGGGGVAKAGDLFFGRKGREIASLGDTVDRLSDQLAKSDERMDRFTERLDECHEHHQNCEQGRRLDQERHQAERREDRERHAAELAELKSQISALMGGEPPAYQQTDLRRVGPRRA